MRRYGMLIGLAVAGAVVVAASQAAPASSAQETTTAADDEIVILEADQRELPLVFAASGTSLNANSPIIETSARLIGVTWTDDQPVVVNLRTRDAEGRWSAWAPLDAIDTGADAAESTNQNATEPKWIGSEVTAVQFQTTRSESGLTAVLLGAPTEQSTALGEASTSTATTDNGVVVNLRDAWDDGCRNPEAKVRLSDVKLAVVHHTAGSNTYASSDVPSIINAICHYHVDSLGWDDIGYNFLVDRFGNVWEGRTGGIDVPVSGAHSAGFNSLSTGVALMGDHVSSQPTAGALTSVANVIGWKLWLDGVPATGTVPVVSQGSALWPAGTQVTLNRVSGHRNVQSTTCPGDAAYDDLPSIRSAASSVIASLPDRPITSDEIFFYNNDGVNIYYDIASDATLQDVIRVGKGYSSGWSTIAEIDLDNDGQDELLFYRTDGVFRYYDITPDAKLNGIIHSGAGYSPDWSTITAVDLDGGGQDELLFYRADGVVRYYDIASDGLLDELIRSGTDYEQDWTTITAIDLDGDGQDELLFYRTDGTFAYYNVTADAVLEGIIASGAGYSPDWSTIAAVDLDGDGQDELLFYRTDGTYRYYEVDADAKLTRVIRSGTGYSPGWATITAVDLDG